MITEITRIKSALPPKKAVANGSENTSSRTDAAKLVKAIKTAMD
jgi:hypothetical protein